MRGKWVVGDESKRKEGATSHGVEGGGGLHTSPKGKWATWDATQRNAWQRGWAKRWVRVDPHHYRLIDVRPAAQQPKQCIITLKIVFWGLPVCEQISGMQPAA